MPPSSPGANERVIARVTDVPFPATRRSRPRKQRLPFTGPGLRKLTGWGPALVSFAAALAYGLYVALRTYEVDLGVYLRLGGRYIFTNHLYSFGLPNTSLLFTYPPFAALLF